VPEDGGEGFLDAVEEKTLLYEWKKEYPDLIQDHMFQIFNQKPILGAYCFGELSVGIYFARQGYKFLFEPWLENFLLAPAGKKLRELQKRFKGIFINAAGQEIYDLITNKIASKQKKGQPDLFVYKGEECFFAEIKRKFEKLGEDQLKFIGGIFQYKIPIDIKIICLEEIMP